MAYPISSEILKLFLSQYRQVIRITVAGQNETFELTENDIVQNGFTVSRYSVSGSMLELGSAISSEVDIVLNNKDGRFNAISFEGAELYVEVGIKKWDARRWENAILHYVPIGYFTVDNSPRKSQTITLASLDRMMRFAKNVVREKLVFPTTVGTLLRAICGECGITLATDISTLPNINQNIPECPEDEDLTYRTLIQWIAQLTGTCAYIDWEGKLRLEWYKTSKPIRLTPATRYTPSDLAECDIVITGVELITDEDTTYLCGEETYTLIIEGNRLIQGNYEEILRNIYNAVGNLTYRPYSCSTKPLPHLFPMDMVEWENAEGNIINTILTNYSFSLNCSTALEAKGETETDLSYASADPLTSQEKTVISRMRKDVSREITSRQQAVLDLNETIANSLGLYETRVELKDKSILCYYHDKPTLAESTAIYTRNANGYAWTVGEECWNDGNPTWQYGYTKEGNAVYNALSAYRIQTDLLDAGCVTADKIKAGAIGGFIIDENHIGIGKTSYNDTENDGVYISTGGIGLGKGKFYVDSQGYIYAEEGVIGGCEIKDGLLIVPSANITGMITASQIDASKIKVNAANITGTLSSSQINANGMVAENVSISGTFSSTGVNDNTVTLSDGYMTLSQNWNTCTTSQIVSSTSNTISNDKISMSIGVDNGGDARGYLGCGGGTISFTQEQAQLYGTWLGTSSVAVTSDVNKKHDIKYLSEKYDTFFDNLIPRLFKYNDGTSDRFHTGFIAQEVETGIYDSSLTTQDFAGFVKAEIYNESENISETSCFLRYEEFIALNTWQIQKLKQRIGELESKIGA